MSNLASKLPSPKYRPDIDGLRAVAVLAVIFYHLFPNLIKGGFVGVDVFFVISSYLISSKLFESLENETFSFKEFYARRIRRIFPALLLVLTTVYVFGWFTLLADEYQQLGKHIAASAGFVSNLVLWSEDGYFDTIGELKPLLHLWSLGIEEQFYIIWPFLLWCTWKIGLPPLALLCTLGGASFYLNLVGVENDSVGAFYSPQTRMWELMLGSLLAWVFRRDRVFFAQKSVANILSTLGITLLVTGFFYIDMAAFFPGKWALAPVLGTVMIIAAGQGAWINRYILCNRVAVWVGLISFPLYLWHWPLLSLSRIVGVGAPTPTIRIGILLLSFLLSSMTYYLVEQPIRFGRWRSSSLFYLSLFLFVIGGAGYNTYLRDGVPSRSVAKTLGSFYSTTSKNIEEELNSHFRNYVGASISSSAKPIILILGDSFLPNWSVALVSHIDKRKFDIVSLSYLGCEIELRPEGVGVRATKTKFDGYCQLFDSFINNSFVTQRIASVMLVSYRPFEYKENRFRFPIIRWIQERRKDAELFVFGNYFQLDPEKHNSCLNLMVRSKRNSEKCLEAAQYPAQKTPIRNLPLYPKDLRFRYVDMIGLHCSYSKTGCASSSHGVPFILDSEHLTTAFIDYLLSDIRERKPSELKKLGLSKYFNERSKSGFVQKSLKPYLHTDKREKRIGSVYSSGLGVFY